MKRKVISLLVIASLVTTSSTFVFAQDTQSNDVVAVEDHDGEQDLTNYLADGRVPDGIDLCAGMQPYDETIQEEDLTDYLSDGRVPDGVDTMAGTEPTFTTSSDGVQRGNQAYSSTGFTTGVYIGGGAGANFAIGAAGAAQYTSANQSAVNSGQTIDLTYQLLDAGTESVYAGQRVVGNQTNQTIDASSRKAADTSCKAYINNNTGVDARVSGSFLW